MTAGSLTLAKPAPEQASNKTDARIKTVDKLKQIGARLIVHKIFVNYR
jgi:hypothetical protein